MITEIREKLFKNKVMAYVLFGIVGISFIIPGIIHRFSAGGMIATVNGRSIDHWDYNRKMFELDDTISAYRHYYGPQAEMVLQLIGLAGDIQKIALDGVIRTELLNQAAQSMDLHFDQETVQNALRDQTFIRQYLGDVIPMNAM